MNKSKLVRKAIREKIISYRKTLKETKNARNLSPSARESWSDTSRNRAESMILALETEISKLKESLENLPKEDSVSSEKIVLWSLVNLKLGNGEMNILLVPEGMGGKKEKNIRFISTESPLGKIITGKKAGFTFLLNRKKGVVLLVV